MSQSVTVYSSNTGLDLTTTLLIMGSAKLIGSYIPFSFTVLYSWQNYQSDDTEKNSITLELRENEYSRLNTINN